MSRKRPVNSIRITIPAKSVNEYLARSVAASFAAQLDPPVSVITDLKTVVSEAVTNAIVHAYPDRAGEIYITCEHDGNGKITIRIKDKGVGIANVAAARQPLFTTSPESERSGMGFTIMENFTDKMIVRSRVGKGTTVTLVKKITPVL